MVQVSHDHIFFSFGERKSMKKLKKVVVKEKNMIIKIVVIFKKIANML